MIVVSTCKKDYPLREHAYHQAQQTGGLRYSPAAVELGFSADAGRPHLLNFVGTCGPDGVPLGPLRQTENIYGLVAAPHKSYTVAAAAGDLALARKVMGVVDAAAERTMADYAERVYAGVGAQRRELVKAEPLWVGQGHYLDADGQFFVHKHIFDLRKAKCPDLVARDQRDQRVRYDKTFLNACFNKHLAELTVERLGWAVEVVKGQTAIKGVPAGVSDDNARRRQAEEALKRDGYRPTPAAVAAWLKIHAGEKPLVPLAEAHARAHEQVRQHCPDLVARIPRAGVRTADPLARQMAAEGVVLAAVKDELAARGHARQSAVVARAMAAAIEEPLVRAEDLWAAVRLYFEKPHLVGARAERVAGRGAPEPVLRPERLSERVLRWAADNVGLRLQVYGEAVVGAVIGPARVITVDAAKVAGEKGSVERLLRDLRPASRGDAHRAALRAVRSRQYGSVREALAAAKRAYKTARRPKERIYLRDRVHVENAGLLGPKRLEQLQAAVGAHRVVALPDPGLARDQARSRDRTHDTGRKF